MHDAMGVQVCLQRRVTLLQQVLVDEVVPPQDGAIHVEKHKHVLVQHQIAQALERDVAGGGKGA